MISRRLILSVAPLGLLAATGCAAGSGSSTTEDNGVSGSQAEAGASFPVEITHTYGTTEVPSAPSRVVTISWVNADIVLALGVVPVGMDADSWGGNDNKSTDWKDAKLEELGAPIGSDKAPKQFDTENGIAFDAIAALGPDLIVGAYSGMTQEEYDKLSKIAPVIGPGKPDYQTPWEESTTMIATALGKAEAGKKLIDDVIAQVRAAGVEANPDLATVTGIAGDLTSDQGTISIYAKGDNRSRFLELLGVPVAEFVSENSEAEDFYFEWSAERAAEVESDLFFTWAPSGTTAEDIAKHNLYGQLPAAKKGGLVLLTDEMTTLSLSAASPLSLPWALDQVVPKFVEATKKVLAQ